VPGAGGRRGRAGRPNVRVGPVELPDSAQLRLRRLYPKAQYKPAARLVTVPRPVESGRIGGAPLRDVALLDWCATLVGDLLPAAQVAGV
jgi:transcription-repair coupling factor (superfamily II helicase)